MGRVAKAVGCRGVGCRVSEWGDGDRGDSGDGIGWDAKRPSPSALLPPHCSVESADGGRRGMDDGGGDGSCGGDGGDGTAVLAVTAISGGAGVGAIGGGGCVGVGGGGGIGDGDGRGDCSVGVGVGAVGGGDRVGVGDCVSDGLAGTAL